MKIKKNDQVQVIAGKDRGKRGTVLAVLPARDRVIVEGINIHKKHVKSKTQGKPGERIEIPASLHVSNVMVVDPGSNKPTRIGYQVTATQKIRIAKRTGKEL